MVKPQVARAGRRWRTGRGHVAGGHADAREGRHMAGRLAVGGHTG